MTWKIGAAWKRVVLAGLLAGTAAFTAVQQQGPIRNKEEWLVLLDSVIGSQPADSAGRHTQGERVVDAHLAMDDEVYQGFARGWQSEFARELAAGVAGNPTRFLSFAQNIRRQAASEPYIKGRKRPPPPVVMDTCIGYYNWSEPTLWRPAQDQVRVSVQFWSPELGLENKLERGALGVDFDRQVAIVRVPAHLDGQMFLCSDTDGLEGYNPCSNPKRAKQTHRLTRGGCAGCWEIPFSRLESNNNFKVKFDLGPGASAYYNWAPGTEKVVFVVPDERGGPEGMYGYANFEPKRGTLDDLSHYPDSTKARIRALQATRPSLVSVNIADWDWCIALESMLGGRFNAVSCQTPENRMKGICVIGWRGFPGLWGIVYLADIDPAVTYAPLSRSASPRN